VISSSSSFFHADAISSARDLILLKKSAMVDDPFYALASVMRVLMIRPRDCDTFMSWMAFQTSVDVVHVEICTMTSLDTEDNM